MDLKIHELKVFYNNSLDCELERDLKELLARYGYKQWASSTNMETGVRVLGFDFKGCRGCQEQREKD